MPPQPLEPPILPLPAGREVADPVVGTVLAGRYRIAAVLADGATGRVYRAVQEPLGRRVALKLMHVRVAQGTGAAAFAERFLREASLAGQLQHPNVVTVHDFGTLPDGRCFIVMEFLEGQSLSAVLRDGPMPPVDVVELFGQIVRGLRHAHRAGLVHRDVKPANVMVVPGEDGRPLAKVLDFGLVKALEGPADAGGGEAGEGSADLTQVGTFLGTPQYIAPEQARGEEADARADLYAVGVMLYRALCGRLPFDVDSSVAAVHAHVNLPIPPMRVRAPRVVVPDSLEQITMRCLAKSPADRFADADELLRALRMAGASLGAPSFLPPLAGSPLGGVDSSLVGAPAVRSVEAPLPDLELDPAGATVVEPQFAQRDITTEEVAFGGEMEEPAAVEEPVAGPAAGPETASRPILPLVVLGLVVAMGVAVAGWWVANPREVAPEPVAAAVEAPKVVEAPPKAAEAPPKVVEAPPKAVEAPPKVVEAPPKAVEPEVVANVEEPPPPKAPVVHGAKASPPVAKKSVPAPALTAVVADGVRFDGAEAAAATRFVNTASHDALLAAGIAPRQVKIIEEGRPFADVAAFAETPFIGEKTVASVLSAVRTSP